MLFDLRLNGPLSELAVFPSVRNTPFSCSPDEVRGRIHRVLLFRPVARVVQDVCSVGQTLDAVSSEALLKISYSIR